MTDISQAPAAWRLQPLDDKLYYLDADEKDFFQKETKIKDEEELKQHIIRVQTKAYSLFPYPCIYKFGFARLKLARLPAYQDLLRLGRERKGAIFIDIGCCFGNDVRKLVQDGYPVENVLVSDIRGDLWKLGYELFKSTPESFPVPLVEGDILDLNFLETEAPCTLESPATSPIPSLKTLTSLNPLRGHVSAMNAVAFFHLFTEQDQLRIAKKLAGLLSAEPGSMLLGSHVGLNVKGFWGPDTGEPRMFCHSPESWKEMWDDVFGKGKVEVKAMMQSYLLEWSVTRL